MAHVSNFLVSSAAYAHGAASKNARGSEPLVQRRNSKAEIRSSTPSKHERSLPPTPPTRVQAHPGAVEIPSRWQSHASTPPAPPPPPLFEWEMSMSSCSPAVSSTLARNVTSTPPTANSFTPRRRDHSLPPTPPQISPYQSPHAAANKLPFELKTVRRKSVDGIGSPKSVPHDKTVQRPSSIDSCLRRRSGQRAGPDHVSFKETRKLASIHLIDQDLPAQAHLSQGLARSLESQAHDQTLLNGLLRHDALFASHSENNSRGSRPATPVKTYQGSGSVCESPSLPNFSAATKGGGTHVQCISSSNRAASFQPAAKDTPRRMGSGSAMKELLCIAQGEPPGPPAAPSASRASSLPPTVGVGREIAAPRAVTPRKENKEVPSPLPPPGSTLPRAFSMDAGRAKGDIAPPGGTIYLGCLGGILPDGKPRDENPRRVRHGTHAGESPSRDGTPKMVRKSSNLGESPSRNGTPKIVRHATHVGDSQSRDGTPKRVRNATNIGDSPTQKPPQPYAGNGIARTSNSTATPAKVCSPPSPPATSSARPSRGKSPASRRHEVHAPPAGLNGQKSHRTAQR